LNALCHCKETQLHGEIIALADAWVQAATTLEVPLEPWSEKTFENRVAELNAAAINGFHEELDVISRESQIPLSSTIGDRQIESVMKSALSEQKRRLRSEGIKAAHAQMQQLLGGTTVTPVAEETVYPGQVSVQYFQSSPQVPDASGEIIRLFQGQPGFPSSQVWMRDRMNRLGGTAIEDHGAWGSDARARFVLTYFNIRAAAFHRLVSTIETQNAFMALLDCLEHVAWTEFIGFGMPTAIRPGSPSIAAGIARRQNWWRRQGYRRLVGLGSMEKEGARPKPDVPQIHQLSEELRTAVCEYAYHNSRATFYYERVSEPELATRGTARPPGKGGSPPSETTKDIHKAWAEMGKPKITATVCDKLADTFFADELKGILRASPKHRKVRERVRQALQRCERRPATLLVSLRN
jgi:hypothetical protein